MYTTESLKTILTPIAKRYGLKKLSVFGSVARGEATEKSDVDLLVDTPKGWGLIAFCGLRSDIEDTLNCPIDLVSTGIEDKKFLSRIHQDEVVLYEQ
mgnify:CR=1 FL=1